MVAVDADVLEDPLVTELDDITARPGCARARLPVLRCGATELHGVAAVECGRRLPALGVWLVPREAGLGWEVGGSGPSGAAASEMLARSRCRRQSTGRRVDGDRSVVARRGATVASRPAAVATRGRASSPAGGSSPRGLGPSRRRVEPHHWLRCRTPRLVSAGVRSNGDFDTAAPRWSSVACGTTLARSNALNVSRSAATIASGTYSGWPGRRSDAVHADGEGDGVDLAGAVGLEDLVQGSHGDLPHGAAYRSFCALTGSGVAVISSFALTYRYSFTVGQRGRLGDVDRERQLAGARSNLCSCSTGNASG